jgi:hypothetical protein
MPAVDNPRMHLMIPFASASLSEAGRQAFRGLRLPHLSKLLARLDPTERLGTDEDSLSTPFERALAATLQWHGEDGCLPWAARAAARDGIDTGTRAWGQLTPVHWHVAADHVSLPDPYHLHLSAKSSQTLFEAVRPLFESEGWTLAWGAPGRWYVSHDSLDGLPCASLDRVIGHPIDRWLPQHPQAKLFRRLQNEAQMLLYQHPLNDERVGQGALPVNSFWLSGCGRPQPPAGPAEPEIDLSLRAPMRSHDWPAWEKAWEALDEGPVREAMARLSRSEALTLTLAGERYAQRFESKPRSWLSKLLGRPAALAPVMEAL